MWMLAANMGIKKKKLWMHQDLLKCLGYDVRGMMYLPCGSTWIRTWAL